jgi:flotillin
VKTPPNMAFVRSGLGGKKVVVDGGAIVLPVVHTLQWISLETIKLEVVKAQKEAFITKDRFRVDIGAEFYLRVAADPHSIERASRSLGDRSFNVTAIQALIEEKLVSALRSVAATTQLVELHENRHGFAQAVKETLLEPLSYNGLTLEDVSVFHLDQTGKEYLDPTNIFDAEGLRQITLQTSERTRERNEIERNTEVAIKRKDVETMKLKLTLDQERALAEHAQQVQIQTDAARAKAETERFVFDQERTAREAEIAKERAIREIEIARERIIQEADIGREQAIRAAQIVREIAVIHKEKERLQEEASRLQLEATREAAAEAVLTVQEKAKAERAKEIALIAALQEMEVAERRLQAVTQFSQSRRVEGEAEAYARAKLREAENLIDQKVIYHNLLSSLIEKSPQILAELMAPAKSIDSIKVLTINGEGLGANGARAGSHAMVSSVIRAFLEAGAALPLLKEILAFTQADGKDFLEKVVEHVPGLAKTAQPKNEPVRSGG